MRDRIDKWIDAAIYACFTVAVGLFVVAGILWMVWEI